MTVPVMFLTIVQVIVLTGLVIRYQSLFERYAEKALLAIFAYSLVSRELVRNLFDPLYTRVVSSSQLFNTVGIEKAQLIIETVSASLPALLVFAIALARLLYKKRAFVVELYRYEKVLIFLGVYNVVTFAVGVLLDNNLEYLLSDTYKLVVFPLVYVAMLIVVDRKRIFEWFRAVYVLFVASVLVTILKQLGSLVVGDFAEISSVIGAFYVVPLLVVSLSIPDTQSPLPVSRNYQFGILVATFGSVLLSLSRGDWIVTLSVVALFVVTSTNRYKLLSPVMTRSGALLSAGSVVGVTSNSGKIFSLIDEKIIGIKKDINDIDELLAYKTRARGSLSQKIAEALDVLRHMADHGSVATYVLGFGNGAEYDTIVSKVSSSAAIRFGESNHNIHNLLFAQLFRRGIVGVLLVVWLFASASLTYFRSWQQSTGEHRLIFGAIFLTIVAIFIKEMSVSSVFLRIEFIILFGLGGVLLRTSDEF